MATALGLMVRQRLTGLAPPKLAQASMAMVEADIEAKAGKDLDDLAANIGDQAAFAHISAPGAQRSGAGQRSRCRARTR